MCFVTSLNLVTHVFCYQPELYIFSLWTNYPGDSYHIRETFYLKKMEDRPWQTKTSTTAMHADLLRYTFVINFKVFFLLTPESQSTIDIMQRKKNSAVSAVSFSMKFHCTFIKESLKLMNLIQTYWWDWSDCHCNHCLILLFA